MMGIHKSKAFLQSHRHGGNAAYQYFVAMASVVEVLCTRLGDCCWLELQLVPDPDGHLEQHFYLVCTSDEQLQKALAIYEEGQSEHRQAVAAGAEV